MFMLSKEDINNYKNLLANYLIEKHGILNLKKKFKCLNPDHDDRHPSMSYSSKYNICKCFACGVSYDIFDIIGIDYGVNSFKDKLEIIDKLYPNISNIVFKKMDVVENKNNIIDFTNYFKKCISKIDETNYLIDRKIDKKLLEKYKIGFDDKRNLIVFPINKNCYFARSVSNDCKLKSTGTSYLWNEKLLEKSNEKTLIYVTEGIIDSLSLETIDANIKTISLNGLPNYKRLLKVIEDNNFIGNLVLVFDNDKTGEMYESIVKEELKKRNINTFSTTLVYNMKVKDVNEALIKNKDLLVKNYNYFNENFNIIINKNNEEKERSMEL